MVVSESVEAGVNAAVVLLAFHTLLFLVEHSSVSGRSVLDLRFLPFIGASPAARVSPSSPQRSRSQHQRGYWHQDRAMRSNVVMGS